MGVVWSAMKAIFTVFAIPFLIDPLTAITGIILQVLELAAITSPLWAGGGAVLGSILNKRGWEDHQVAKIFVWRASDGGPLNGYEGHKLNLTSYNNDTHTAVACYEDRPHLCGTMWNVRDGCGSWLGWVGTDKDGSAVIDPWNPNGTMYVTKHDGTEGTHGKWIMSISDLDIIYCYNHMPDRKTPWGTVTVESSMDFNDTIVDHLDQWDGTKKRALSALAEVEAHFATLPHAGALEDTVAGGAAMLHRHMGNESLAQSMMLFHAFDTILQKSEKRHKAWSLVRRGSVRADEVIHSLRERVIATAYEEDRKFLGVFANSAIMKAIMERVKAGKSGHTEGNLIKAVQDSIHGENKLEHSTLMSGL